jgi:hypothetical protein
MSSKKPSQTQTTPADVETTAAELVVMFESGETAEATARIQTLSRQNFIQVMRTVQQLDTALSSYALSWRHAEYWGRGTPYPDEAKAA